MNNKFYYALVTALALFFCAVAYCFAQGQAYMGTCVRVIDGDTVDIADENQNLHRIRIIGLDTPELAQPYGRAAPERFCYGGVARDDCESKCYNLFVA